MNYKLIMLLTVAAVIVCGLSGCAARDPLPIVRTQEVDVSVPTARVAPDALRWTPPAATEVPQMVGPTDPRASSCFTVAGEDQARTGFGGMKAHLEAWEVWGFHD